MKNSKSLGMGFNASSRGFNKEGRTALADGGELVLLSVL